MATLPERKDIPPWVKVPEDLKDPEVFQLQTRLVDAMLSWRDRGIAHFEQVGKVMLELKALESSDLTEVTIYGADCNRFRTRWMMESLAEWHRKRLEKGMVKLEEAMQTLGLDPGQK